MLDTSNTEFDMLWWLIGGVLAGMPMPFVAPERRLNGSSELDAFDDSLPKLHRAGIRSVVCLLNIPSDKQVYTTAGFEFLCSPIPDYGAPTIDQARMLCTFIDNAPNAVAVHCEGGIGRTGTILASYLILHGTGADAAVQKVRDVEPAAIETASQVRFLQQLAEAPA